MRCAGAAFPARFLSLLTLAAFQASAQDLSPQEIFRRVAPSVVIVEVWEADKPDKTILSGSGIVIPSSEKDITAVVTNCHVVDKAPYGAVTLTAGETRGLGWIAGKDSARDLCIIHALFYDVDAKGVPLKRSDGEPAYRKLTAVQIGSSQWLEVGDPVYAVGAPQGLEMSLSNGLVSGFREYKSSEYIQTTAPISSGSSGGGLFDAQGRLVGITTLYHKDGQALNFAVPAELITSVPKARNTPTTANDSNTETSAVREAADSAAAAAAAAATAQAAAEAVAAAVAEAEAEADPAPSHGNRHGRTTDRWWTFYRSGKREIAFDLETVNKTGTSVTVWERTKFVTPQRSTSGETYVEEVARSTYYCGSRKHSSDQFTWRDANGEVVYSRTLEIWEIERLDVMPETVGEAMYEAACNP